MLFSGGPRWPLCELILSHVVVFAKVVGFLKVLGPQLILRQACLAGASRGNVAIFFKALALFASLCLTPVLRVGRSVAMVGGSLLGGRPARLTTFAARFGGKLTILREATPLSRHRLATFST